MPRKDDVPLKKIAKWFYERGILDGGFGLGFEENWKVYKKSIKKWGKMRNVVFFQLKKKGYYFECPRCRLIFRKEHTMAYCPSGGLCLKNLNYFENGLTRDGYLHKIRRLQEVLGHSRKWSVKN